MVYTDDQLRDKMVGFFENVLILGTRADIRRETKRNLKERTYLEENVVQSLRVVDIELIFLSL